MRITLSTNHEDIFLQPGEWFFGQGNITLRTLLGSCIAITLWHPLTRHGGMCHFMLPARGSIRPTQAELDGRYGDEAMALMLAAIGKTDTLTSDYEVKVFGGGQMYPASSHTEPIAQRNITAALHLLAEAGLSIQGMHIGESGHRKILFELTTGDVWVKYTPNSSTHGQAT